MMNEPNAMREIHEIREKIYEDTKHLTPEEYNARVRKRTKSLLDRYGIKVETIDPGMSVRENLHL
jgi:hypothetical protein